MKLFELLWSAFMAFDDYVTNSTLQQNKHVANPVCELLRGYVVYTFWITQTFITQLNLKEENYIPVLRKKDTHVVLLSYKYKDTLLTLNLIQKIVFYHPVHKSQCAGCRGLPCKLDAQANSPHCPHFSQRVQFSTSSFR